MSGTERSRPELDREFEQTDSPVWWVIDTESEGPHTHGRVVAGPMGQDSAERASHEMNDHAGSYRYLAAQKLLADVEET